MPSFTLTIALLAGAYVACGCTVAVSGSPTVETPETFDVPTHQRADPDEPVDAALIEGVLVVDPAQDGGCIWITSGEILTPVYWPDGYAGRVNPPALIGPDGQVVAESGERISVGGGGGEHPDMERCRFREDWVFRAEVVDAPGS